MPTLIPNRIGIPYGGVLAPAFLSQFPDTALALSLQKLSKEPTDVIRARRSSDNAERDFTANEVKNGTLLNWVDEIPEIPTDFASSLNVSGVTNNLPDGWSGTSLVNDCRIQMSSLLSVSNGNIIKVRFNYSSETGGSILIRSGITGNISNTINLVQGLNEYTFTINSSASEARLTWLFSNAQAGFHEVTELEITEVNLSSFVPTWYDQTAPTNKSTLYFNGGKEDSSGVGINTSITSNSVTSTFTMFAKCYPKIINNSFTAGRYRVISRTDGTSTRGAIAFDTNKIQFLGNGATLLREQAATPNTEYSLIITFTEPGYKIWVNGVLVQTNTTYNLFDTAAGSSPFAVGSHLTVDSRFFEGLIWNAGLIKRELTISEISALAADELPSSIIEDDDAVFTYRGFSPNISDYGTVSWLNLSDNTKNGTVYSSGAGIPIVRGSISSLSMANDAVQTVAATQPFIVIDGVQQEGVNFNENKRLVCYMDGLGAVDQGVMYNMKLNSVLTSSGSNNRKSIFRHSNPLWNPGIWMASDVFRQHYLMSEPSSGRYWDYTNEYNDLDWHSFVGSGDVSVPDSNMWSNGSSKTSLSTSAYNATTSLTPYFIIGDELDNGSQYSLNAQIQTLVWVKKLFTEKDSKMFNRIIKV